MRRSIHKLRVTYAMLAGVTATTGVNTAYAEDGLPTGQDVYAEFVDTVGGDAAIGKVQSFHISGSYDLPDFGLEGTIDLHYARPDQLLMVVDLPGFGQIRRGFDDGVSWSIDPHQGARVLEGEDAQSAQRLLLRAFSILPSAGVYEEIETVSRGEFNGAECHMVSLRFPGGESSVTEWFNAETGLLVGREETTTSPQGDVTLNGVCSEYEDHGGVLIATKWDHEAAGQRWTAKYTDFEFNAVDNAVFAFPAEIQELLDES